MSTVESELVVGSALTPLAQGRVYLRQLPAVYFSPICKHCQIPLQVANVEGHVFFHFPVVFDPEHEPALVAMGVSVVSKVYIVLVLGQLGNKFEVGILVIAFELDWAG